jgi:hypothetical protein
MRALSLLLSIAALLTVPSCSFLGLDNLPVAGCTMDSQCDGLERLEPPASECETWQCNGGFCELATRDEDEDGVSPMLSPSMLMCTQPGDPIDCDDGAGVTFPGNPEVCDGLDNDCDGLVDQGQPGVMLGADRSFTTITGSALSAVVANGGRPRWNGARGPLRGDGDPAQPAGLHRARRDGSGALLDGRAHSVRPQPPWSASRRSRSAGPCSSCPGEAVIGSRSPPSTPPTVW